MAQLMVQHVGRDLVDEAPERIIGFYAVAIRAMTSKGDIPPALARRSRLHAGPPGHRQGFATAGQGVTLLVDAMERVRAVADQVGGYDFFVDANIVDAAGFYTYFRLPKASIRSVTPVLAIADFSPL